MPAKLHTPSIEDQRQFWNVHWQLSDERKVLNAWTERRAETILATIQELAIQGPRILDFGCGNGWFTERLASLGEVKGIDLSSEAIAIAKSRRPDIEFVAGNVYRTELPKGYFDVVVSQEVIAHVENQPKYIERAAEVLKPGGYLIITTGNKYVMDRLGDVGWITYPPEHIEHELSRGEMKQLLRPQFTFLRSRTIIPHGTRGILRLINSYRLASLLCKFTTMEKLNDLKERAGFGWQMVVLAQKKHNQ